MSLKDIIKKGGTFIAGSALFLSLGIIPCNQQLLYEQPRNFYCVELKQQTQQKSLRYNLEIYVLGFELINKTMNWNETVTEDSAKLEHKLDISLRASKKYWGFLNMRKIDYKNSQNLEWICEEFTYGLSDGEKVETGHVKIYPDRAEVYQEGMLIIKNGKYTGVLSFMQDLMKGDMKIGETRVMDVLFGKNAYNFRYKVVGKETMYEKYDYVRDGGDWNYEGRGESFETYKIELKIRNPQGEEMKRKVFFWIGKEGKHKNEIVKIEIIYNWAISVKMVMKDLF